MKKQEIKELQRIWNNLDVAYGKLENAFYSLTARDDIPDDMRLLIDRFDMSYIPMIMHYVEDMLDSAKRI